MRTTPSAGWKRNRRVEPGRQSGHSSTLYYFLKQTGALIGFIGALANQRFCDRCSKLRLTADGEVRPCLGNQIEVNWPERSRADDAILKELLKTTLCLKPQKHQFRNQSRPRRSMTAIGGRKFWPVFYFQLATFPRRIAGWQINQRQKRPR